MLLSILAFQITIIDARVQAHESEATIAAIRQVGRHGGEETAYLPELNMSGSCCQDLRLASWVQACCESHGV